RNLSDFKKEESTKGIPIISEAFYNPTELTDTVKQRWNAWFKRYAKRLKDEDLTDAQRKVQMDAVNPKYVLRNYMSQLAIDKADQEDYSLIDELFQLVKRPYDEQPEHQKWFAKRPEWARLKVGSSMLSCSS